MSTSPSWFDQEKFSRLVKKVGPKPITEVLPSVLGSEPETRPQESLASTARISLVSKPASLLAEQRALPALPRRTTPLPSLKALFPAPTAQPPVALVAEAAAPAVEDHAEPAHPPAEHPVPEEEEGELIEIWHKMSLLNEELARTVLERDQALHDIANLREQIRRTAEAGEPKGNSSSTEELGKVTKEKDDAVAQTQSLRVQVLQAKGASAEEISKLTKERDEARAETEKLRAELTQAGDATSGDAAKLAQERDDANAEVEKLRAELVQVRDAAKQKEDAASGHTQQITVLTSERDQSRRQYVDLRMQYEKLKAEHVPREETIKFRKEWEQQLDELKQKLEERDKEIAALKNSAEAAGSGDDKIKTELASLREQLTKVKDEASIAQRGLALSQKALQQTRDALREATEGTSLSRHNFDNLKNECAILAQQNTVLQAQVDQFSRDTKSANLRITTRVSQ